MAFRPIREEKGNFTTPRRGPGPGKIEKARDPRQAITRLIPYLKPFRVGLAIVMVFVVLYTLLGLVGPYLMGVAIDRFIGGKDPQGLVRTAVLMLVVYLLTNLLHVVANWAMAIGPVTILVNNAGIGGTKAFEQASPDYVDTIISVNVRTMALLSRLLLPELKKAHQAYILNVASMASFSPFAYKTVYPASKAFVYSFSRGLNEELKKTNVFVSVIHPGPIKTNADVIERIEKQGWKGRLGLVSPERLAYIAIRQLFRRDSLILPGVLNKINWTLMALLPNAWKLPLLSRAVRKEMTQVRPAGLRLT